MENVGEVMKLVQSKTSKSGFHIQNKHKELHFSPIWDANPVPSY